MKLHRASDVNLTANEVYIGLLDNGLFAEKVPPCFSTKGLIAAIGTSLDSLLTETDPEKLKSALNKRTHDFARYTVLRDINVPRQFGLPHPESYAVQCLFIKHHWKQISRHNSKPKRHISRIHVRRLSGGRIFVMNYQGLDRFNLEEDEIRWAAGATHLVKADISSCFPSIYTHSIPWALHGRVYSKRKRGLLQSTGNILDSVTQRVRDGQTNGLLIGPHSSNIISELILTRIDRSLILKGYTKLKRYIDDYHFYADSYDEAERFIHDLGLALREFELSINEKKTRIDALPQQIEEMWVREINRFIFPQSGEVKFSSIRSFLDLALELSEKANTSAPLNYAFKMLPANLNARAKRLLVQEAINLALLFPYLAPVLGPNIFHKFSYTGMETAIAEFVNKLIRIGSKKLYPDAIAHALYYAMKFDSLITLTLDEFASIIQLDDCLVNVLLNEYAIKHSYGTLATKLQKKARQLKAGRVDERDVDKQWLFVYQMWTEAELRAKRQVFLADLKAEGFKFIPVNAFVRTPSPVAVSPSSYAP